MLNKKCLSGRALPLRTVFSCNHFMTQRNIGSRRFCCLVTITKKRKYHKPISPSPLPQAQVSKPITIYSQYFVMVVQSLP